LIEPHVLIDREHDSRIGTQLDQLFRFSHRKREWLLCEDAAKSTNPESHGTANQIGLLFGRHRDIEYFDLRIGEQRINRLVNRRHRVPCCDLVSRGGVPRRDGDGVKPGVAIRDEVTIRDDEPRPGAADSPVLSSR